MLRDIRSAFIGYFVEQGHHYVKSSSLIPADDPSLLFTNAGMVQFKDILLGRTPAQHPRVVTSQKCVRAGGKHNDLENVGYTVRHHTFFEMLGNFSFGDYFKEDAIVMAWEFLTRVLALPKERLYVTINNFDEEAGKIWKKVSGLPNDRIVPVAGADNFWSMGSTGPCGPCSEIFYDYGDKYSGTLSADSYDPDERYIEIWNLVFMQSNLSQNGSMVDLPSKSIDTGMGLERIAAVCQGVRDNYCTDVFRRIMSEIGAITGYHDFAAPQMRVVADHVRSASFLISDGVLPGNVGREYALRKILRRAIRYAGKLGNSQLLLGKLVPVVIEVMGDQYPEIAGMHNRIVSVLNAEEEKFADTIHCGMQFLNKCLAEYGRNLPDDLAFKLYDTYGFPFDLTSEILKESGIEVKEADFNKYMEQQKSAGRVSWKGEGAECIDVSGYRATNFVGYDKYSVESVVVGLLVSGRPSESVDAGQTCMVILDTTPFYAVSGGQIGDMGSMLQGNCVVADVLDCTKIGLVYTHACLLKKSLKIGDLVTASIDIERRLDIACNHSATHLLHYALKKILGAHVNQKGSLVADDRLRFDFSHDSPLSDEEIASIEDCVNWFIDRRAVVSVETMSIDKAKNIGAIALFGEKYSNEVRVVEIGGLEAKSIELCGGSHVGNASEIRLFKISSSSSIGSGVRRLEAVTGTRAIALLKKNEAYVLALSTILKAKPDKLVAAASKLCSDDGKKSDTERLLSYAQSSFVLTEQIIDRGLYYLRDKNAVLRGFFGCDPIDLTNSNSKKGLGEALRVAGIHDLPHDSAESLEDAIFMSAQFQIHGAIREFIINHKMSKHIDYIYSAAVVGDIHCVLIHMSTPRYTNYLKLFAQGSNKKNIVVAGAEFVSSKFGKLRLFVHGVSIDARKLIRSLASTKGNVIEDGGVYEVGFSPAASDESAEMQDISDKLQESVRVVE